VDPSYVSRVARGERQSPEVESALAQEIEQINRKLGSSQFTLNAKGLPKEKGKRLHFFVSKKRDSLRHEWLQYTQDDPNIRRIKISARRRASPVIPIVNEALNSMKFSLKEMSSKPMKAATRHGKDRRELGYTPSTLMEEYNLIRRCVYSVAKQNLQHLDTELLIRDLGQFGEVLDFQSQNAMRAFLGQA
jgi:hypothetical protein